MGKRFVKSRLCHDHNGQTLCQVTSGSRPQRANALSSHVCVTTTTGKRFVKSRLCHDHNGQALCQVTSVHDHKGQTLCQVTSVSRPQGTNALSSHVWVTTTTGNALSSHVCVTTTTGKHVVMVEALLGNIVSHPNALQTRGQCEGPQLCGGTASVVRH